MPKCHLRRFRTQFHLDWTHYKTICANTDTNGRRGERRAIGFDRLIYVRRKGNRHRGVNCLQLSPAFLLNCSVLAPTVHKYAEYIICRRDIGGNAMVGKCNFTNWLCQLFAVCCRKEFGDSRRCWMASCEKQCRGIEMTTNYLDPICSMQVVWYLLKLMKE